MNKKHTLVIDGNYFLFRTLYVLPRNKGKILETKADVGIFVRKLATDFASEIRKFRTMVDQVVFTIDSKSWRKDFYPQSEYKGNRSSDESINWENFVKGGEDFKEFLKSKGVILHKVNGAEGDDLIFAWSVNANYREKPVIVFSGDRDLLQLVNYNQSTRSYTIFYSNTHKKLCVFKGFSDWLEREEHQVTDIFDMQKSVEGDNIIRNGLKSLIKDSKLNLEEIHPGEFAFKKVLTGDAGDNVKPVYYYQVTKEDKTRNYGLSDKKAEMIFREFEKKYGTFKIEYLYDEEYQRQICNLIVKHLNADKMPFDRILQNIKDNTHLVILHQRSIPEEITNQMFELVDQMQDLKIPNFEAISSKDELLKGSSYLTENYRPASSNFFEEGGEEDRSFILKSKPSDSLF